MKIFWIDGVRHPFISFCINVELGTEWSGINLFLGALINNRPLVAVNGCTIGIRFYKVLLNFRSQVFKHIAKPAKKWEVALDGLVSLHHVGNTHINKGGNQ